MRGRKKAEDVVERKTPATLSGRMNLDLELQQAMLAEQRETNRLLRELLAQRS